MSERKVSLILSHMAEQIAPGDEINLWPGLQARFQASASNQKRGIQMNTRITLASRLRLAAIIAVTLVLAFALFLASPPGRTWAQAALQFFTRAESNSLPVQTFQMTPVPATAAPDPGDINNATLTIDQAEEQAGYRVYKPETLPQTLTLVGATFDQGKRAVRIFYRDVDTNGLVLRQEPYQTADDCELCGKVGADATVEEVQIGSASGEYAEGVWQLTDEGPKWVSDPWLKTMRWQANGMAFELLFMGSPDNLTKADMVAIAESMQ